MNEILVPLGAKAQLKKQFNCSYPTIHTALLGKSKSMLSLKIRHAALEKGGAEIKMNLNGKKYIIL